VETAVLELAIASLMLLGAHLVFHAKRVMTNGSRARTVVVPTAFTREYVS
jgi:hypothetical protein